MSKSTQPPLVSHHPSSKAARATAHEEEHGLSSTGHSSSDEDSAKPGPVGVLSASSATLSSSSLHVTPKSSVTQKHPNKSKYSKRKFKLASNQGQHDASAHKQPNVQVVIKSSPTASADQLKPSSVVATPSASTKDTPTASTTQLASSSYIGSDRAIAMQHQTPSSSSAHQMSAQQYKASNPFVLPHQPIATDSTGPAPPSSHGSDRSVIIHRIPSSTLGKANDAPAATVGDLNTTIDSSPHTNTTTANSSPAKATSPALKPSTLSDRAVMITPTPPLTSDHSVSSNNLMTRPSDSTSSVQHNLDVSTKLTTYPSQTGTSSVTAQSSFNPFMPASASHKSTAAPLTATAVPYTNSTADITILSASSKSQIPMQSSQFNRPMPSQPSLTSGGLASATQSFTKPPPRPAFQMPLSEMSQSERFDFLIRALELQPYREILNIFNVVDDASLKQFIQRLQSDLTEDMMTSLQPSRLAEQKGHLYTEMLKIVRTRVNVLIVVSEDRDAYFDGIFKSDALRVKEFWSSLGSEFIKIEFLHVSDAKLVEGKLRRYAIMSKVFNWSRFVLHYCGHGKGGKMLFADGSSIAHMDMIAMIGSIQAPAKFLVFDMCESGVLVDAFTPSNANATSLAIFGASETSEKAPLKFGFTRLMLSALNIDARCPMLQVSANLPINTCVLSTRNICDDHRRMIQSTHQITALDVFSYVHDHIKAAKWLCRPVIAVFDSGAFVIREVPQEALDQLSILPKPVDTITGLFRRLERQLRVLNKSFVASELRVFRELALNLDDRFVFPSTATAGHCTYSSIQALFSKPWSANQRVLITGSPGSGKTAVCAQLAYLWAMRCGWLSSFDFLICVILQLSSCDQKYDNLWQLLASFLKVEPETLQQVFQGSLNQTLLVVDGIDHLNDAQLSNIRPLLNVLKGSSEFRPHVIVTCRISKAGSSRALVSALTRSVEIVGFPDQFIQNQNIHALTHALCKYDTRTIADEIMARTLKWQLTPSIQSYFEIPFFCNLLVSEVRNCLARSKELPCSAVLSYRMIWSCVECNAVKAGITNALPESIEQAIMMTKVKRPDSVTVQHLSELGEIAFNLIRRDSGPHLLEDESEKIRKLSPLLLEIGLVNTQTSFNGNCEVYQYVFVNKHVRDFLAAFHLAVNEKTFKTVETALIVNKKLHDVLTFAFVMIKPAVAITLLTRIRETVHCASTPILALFLQALDDLGSVLPIGFACPPRRIPLAIRDAPVPWIVLAQLAKRNLLPSVDIELPYTSENDLSGHQKGVCACVGIRTIFHSMHKDNKLTSLRLVNAFFPDCEEHVLNIQQANGADFPIDLMRSIYSHHDMSYLGKFLNKQPLMQIDLSNNGIHSADAAVILNEMGSVPTLVSLNLGQNLISDYAVFLAADKLFLHENFQELNVSSSDNLTALSSLLLIEAISYGDCACAICQPGFNLYSECTCATDQMRFLEKIGKSSQIPALGEQSTVEDSPDDWKLITRIDRNAITIERTTKPVTAVHRGDDVSVKPSINASTRSVIIPDATIEITQSVMNPRATIDPSTDEYINTDTKIGSDRSVITPQSTAAGGAQSLLNLDAITAKKYNDAVDVTKTDSSYESEDFSSSGEQGITIISPLLQDQITYSIPNYPHIKYVTTIGADCAACGSLSTVTLSSNTHGNRTIVLSKGHRKVILDLKWGELIRSLLPFVNVNKGFVGYSGTKACDPLRLVNCDLSAHGVWQVIGGAAIENTWKYIRDIDLTGSDIGTEGLPALSSWINERHSKYDDLSINLSAMKKLDKAKIVQLCQLLSSCSRSISLVMNSCQMTWSIFEYLVSSMATSETSMPSLQKFIMIKTTIIPEVVNCPVATAEMVEAMASKFRTYMSHLEDAVAIGNPEVA